MGFLLIDTKNKQKLNKEKKQTNRMKDLIKIILWSAAVIYRQKCSVRCPGSFGDKDADYSSTSLGFRSLLSFIIS